MAVESLKCGSTQPMARGRLMAALLVISAALVGGCGRPAADPYISSVTRRPQIVEAAGPSRMVVGRSVENRPIECIALGRGPETILFIASIHGNEQVGTGMVYKLAEHLRAQPALLEGRRVVIIPRANPDGMFHATRHNVRGVDLNRNFVADNRENNAVNGPRGLSEPESQAIEKVIEQYDPVRIVTIHQPLTCVDYDGPGAELAARMSALCGLPVKKLGGRPGSLGSYAGMTLGIPIITLELPRSADMLGTGQLWERYGAAMLAAVTWEG